MQNYVHIDVRVCVPVYHCSFSDDPKKQELNMVVSEDLRGRGFQPLQPEICGVRFMRAQMRALASIHATGLAYQVCVPEKGNGAMA